MQTSGPTGADIDEEQRYRVLVNAITDYAIYMLDPSGAVTSWNDGAQRFKGYQREEILGRHFSCFYSEEDRRAGLPARALGIAASEGRYETEGWRVRKDGTRFWAHVVIDRIGSPTGELIGYAKITRDLTERKAAQEALRRREEQFRLLVRSVTDYAIYMLDPVGRVTSWNLGAERIKGYLPDEIIGEHFSRFYTDEDRERGLPEAGLAAARREGRHETEGWRVRKDGARFWAHVVIDAVHDDDGAVIGFAKITRDVTESRQAQRDLQQAREALFQAQKMEAIGRLTGGVAHDFNNLLMVILGSLELVRKRLPDDPAIERLIGNAIQGARRGASLTERMLAFARRQELKREAVDVPALVMSMAGLLDRTLGRSVRIETRFPLGLAAVETDPSQLESALLNLIVNARDAMPQGGVVSISGREADVADDPVGKLSPGRYVCLSVTDTGEGMDAETIERATEPFFTTKGVGKGTGLGLSMVQGLTEQSGGALKIESRPGDGSTVELWLPVAQTAGSNAPARASAPPERSRPLLVLAVDDDALVLMNTVAMLEDLGHAVLQTDNGEQALDILRGESGVDLIVTDQAMPRMTGAQFAEKVRATWPQMPIILATGFAELAPGLGADLPRLAKPFCQADLARAISDALAKRP
jgi:PAS domain S-box-containing protein